VSVAHATRRVQAISKHLSAGHLSAPHFRRSYIVAIPHSRPSITTGPIFSVSIESRTTSAPSTIASHVLTSRKWAAPLADILSARDPASMYTATVEVDMPGMVSDEIDRPLDNVEVCVTGSAYRLV